MNVDRMDSLRDRYQISSNCLLAHEMILCESFLFWGGRHHVEEIETHVEIVILPAK